MRNHSTKIVAAGFVALLLAAGCKRDEVQVYQVQKESTPPPAPPLTATAMTNAALPPGHPDISGMAQTAPATESASPITWTKPAGWTEAAPTEFRVASFKVQDGAKLADISVVPLPGMAGGDDANVNRWRGQIGLPAVSADDVQKSAENVQIDGQPAALYDIAGTDPGSGEASRIIGVIQHRDGTAWFFKMTGDGDLVEKQKPAFIEFLKSVKFSGGIAVAPAEMPTALPPGHPSIGGMGNVEPATGPISHEGQPNWQVPSDWKEVPSGQFLIAKFLIGDGTTAVNVSMSAGDGGGMAANFNRWRGQLGLPPANSGLVGAAVGDTATVDISGTDVQTGKPARLVGAIVPQTDRTWFYKLMGDPKTVEAQKDAFVKFVQSAKY